MSNPSPSVPDLASSVAKLMSQRSLLEADILNLFAELKKQNVGMNEPLVDQEGYPRNDIDVAAVRHLRHDIIYKQNDCKALTKQMEEALHALHAESQISPNSGCTNAKEEYFKPFATVRIVDEGSPAHAVGLQVGDDVVKFEHFKHYNFQGLSSLAEYVARNMEKPLSITVLRNGEFLSFLLVAENREGKPYLGFMVSLKKA